MHVVQKIQDYVEDYFDIALSTKQVILVIFLGMTMIAFAAYYFSIDKIQSDLPDAPIVSPLADAPLFEKK